MRVIIGYKLCKGALVFGIAVWLTLSSGAAFREARHLIAALNDHPGWLHQIATWLSGRVTQSAVHAARIVAWLDCGTTLFEAFLLLSGRVWGEWLVVASVAALLPFELPAVLSHPHPLRIGVLLANLAVVVYLIWRRLRHEGQSGARTPLSRGRAVESR